MSVRSLPIVRLDDSIMNFAVLGFRIRAVVIVLLLMILDIGPIPLTAMICLYVIIARPRWFRDFVNTIYGE